ncbi:hypothetical protein ABIA39_007085 [Nocardia sp. GAS34]|uniref:hypothetical protein n=1 Tax=unclassified Nocardia TaxID=2637762 RepID=UPI003D25D489
MHGDKQVDYLVVDPGLGSVNIPADCGVYPSLSMDITASANDVDAAYGESVPGNEAFSLIIDLSNVIAIAGSSGTWGCWGDRDPGIMAIRAVDTDAFRDWIESLDCYHASAEGILDTVALNIRGGIVPSDFRDRFLLNYR